MSEGDEGGSRQAGAVPSRPSGGSALARCAKGCLAALVAAIVFAVVFLANWQPFGPSPQAVSVDARWAARTVALPADATPVSVRVTISYSGSTDSTVWAAISVGVPREAAGSTPDASSAVLRLTEPAVKMSVAGDSYRGEDCYAACERGLSLPDCGNGCTQVYTVTLQVVDAAGRGPLSVAVSAGASAYLDGHLPGRFEVRIEPVAAPTPASEGSR